jgi:MFS family permease
LGILLSFLAKRVRDKFYLLCGFPLFIIATILAIGYQGLETFNIPKFIIAYIFMWLGSFTAETGAQSLLAKTIPPKMLRGFFNAGMIGGLLDTAARCCGNLLIWIVGQFGIGYITVILYPSYFVVICTLFSLTIIFFKILNKRFVFYARKGSMAGRSFAELKNLKS